MQGEINILLTEHKLQKIRDGVKIYCTLMEDLHKCNVSQDSSFKKRFRWFYRMNQARLSPQFYQVYFDYMEQQKLCQFSFEDALMHLYRSEPLQGIQASFASKLLATINPNMPIWDTNVLSQLSIKRPYCRHDKERQLALVVEAYSNLVAWYASFLKTQKAQDLIAQFDKLLPNTQMTEVKKIDWLLWAMGVKA